MSHTLDGRDKDGDDKSPPIGPDGMTIKTSVCDEINQSVQRATDIENKLSNSKVKKLNDSDN